MKRLFRKTKRLIIRPLDAKDFDAWKNGHLGLVGLRNTWDIGPRPTDELTKANFKKVLSGLKKLREKDRFYDLGVFDRQGDLIGGVSLMEVVRGISHSAFLGYRIFNSHWRKGYGKEAVKATLDIGFNDLKLHRIEAGIEPGNIRSIRLAKSLRMRREGLKKRAIFLRNKWVDLLMYSLTTEDIGKKFNTSVLRHKPRS